jgi:hypothetical protein
LQWNKVSPDRNSFIFLPPGLAFFAIQSTHLLEEAQLARLADDQVGPLAGEDGDEVGRLSVHEHVLGVLHVGPQLLATSPPVEGPDRRLGEAGVATVRKPARVQTLVQLTCKLGLLISEGIPSSKEESPSIQDTFPESAEGRNGFEWENSGPS